MQTRNETITVTELSTLPSTGRECHECEDGVFVRDGCELICDTCQYAPSFDTREQSLSSVEAHREQVSRRAAGDEDGRPRLVGGYKDAYWGDGEYEYRPGVGFTF